MLFYCGKTCYTSRELERADIIEAYGRGVTSTVYLQKHLVALAAYLVRKFVDKEIDENYPVKHHGKIEVVSAVRIASGRPTREPDYSCPYTITLKTAKDLVGYLIGKSEEELIEIINTH